MKRNIAAALRKLAWHPARPTRPVVGTVVQALGAGAALGGLYLVVGLGLALLLGGLVVVGAGFLVETGRL